MLIYPLFILLSISLIIRYNKLLRIYFQSSLYKIGLQIGNNIYTPVCDVHSDFRWFDIVLIKKAPEYLHIHRILHREKHYIPLFYVPVGKNLVYKIDDEISEHLYLEGTPFTVSKGELILYKRENVGRMGFTKYVEIAKSNQWPIVGE